MIIIILIVILIVLIIFIICNTLILSSCQNDKTPIFIKENYGPPPGRQKAVDIYDLHNRGWPSWPLAFQSNSINAGHIEVDPSTPEFYEN